MGRFHSVCSAVVTGRKDPVLDQNERGVKPGFLGTRIKLGVQLVIYGSEPKVHVRSVINKMILKDVRVTHLNAGTSFK